MPGIRIAKMPGGGHGNDGRWEAAGSGNGRKLEVGAKDRTADTLELMALNPVIGAE